MRPFRSPIMKGSARRRSLVLIIVALSLFMLAAPLGAAPPPGKGGGNGGGGGGGGGSTPVPEQHLLWVVELPGMYSMVRPAVGPDGTIYAVDVLDNLYAVRPGGDVAWTAVDAGSKGVDVGPDGTIYTGNENWVKAYNPDGSLKWTFVQNPRAFVFQDVAVGPDGNIYGIGTSGMGVFSLEDRGDHAALRWQTPEIYARTMVSYTELEFGPTSDGQDYQLYFAANGHTRAVRLSDGASVFTKGGGVIKPRVSPFDGSWHMPAEAYSPDGSLLWSFEFPLATGTVGPSMGASGMHYAINSGNTLYSIAPDGRENFHTQLSEYVGSPDVDPTETVVLLPVGGTASTPGAVKAVSASNGTALWRMEFPATDNGLEQFVSSGFSFSAGGDVAYVMTSNYGGTGARGYLVAIATDPSIPSASTVLRSQDITLDVKSRRNGVAFTGTVIVTDENLGRISGATVEAIWTLPDGSTLQQTATTGGTGEARFSVSGAGGLYRLTVTNIALDGFTFDPDHGLLEAARAWF